MRAWGRAQVGGAARSAWALSPLSWPAWALPLLHRSTDHLQLIHLLASRCDKRRGLAWTSPNRTASAFTASADASAASMAALSTQEAAALINLDSSSLARRGTSQEQRSSPEKALRPTLSADSMMIRVRTPRGTFQPAHPLRGCRRRRRRCLRTAVPRARHQPLLRPPPRCACRSRAGSRAAASWSRGTATRWTRPTA